MTCLFVLPPPLPPPHRILGSCYWPVPVPMPVSDADPDPDPVVKITPLPVSDP